MFPAVLVNFHCHSIFSDGDQTPEALAANFARAGVRFAALTDHDTLEGLPRFMDAARKQGISCFPGLELTSRKDGKEYHFLAFGFDPENDELLAVLQRIRQADTLEVHSIADSIRKKGANYSKHSNDNHAALNGETGSLTPMEAISLIHRAGGKAFLAHPLSSVPDFEELEDIVHELMAYGLDGLEAIYDPYSEEQRADLCELADRNQLLVCAGTDIHSNNGVFAIGFPNTRWDSFRNGILASSAYLAEPGSDTNRSNPAKIYEQSPGRAHKFRKRAFVIRIFLPTIIAIGLFLSVIWGVLLPSFEQTLLDRKRELIRELTNSAWSILASYEKDEQNGLLTRDEAQRLALAQVEELRYGPEGKDYFWIQDLQPKMLMHPYRPDLNGKDVSGFVDPRGAPIFVEFANVVRRDGEGYINYVWQWKDDPSRLEPKESFVKGFPPWGWVIGTGIYTDDVHAEIARIEKRVVNTSLAISLVVILLLVFVLQQSMRIDLERQAVVDSLRESTARYHSLVEATTEGTLLVINDRCRYANPTFLRMTGYTALQMEFLELRDLVPHVEENAEFWNRCEEIIQQDFSNDSEHPVAGGLDGVIRRSDGRTLDCVFILNPIVFAGQKGLILLAKDITSGTLPLSPEVISWVHETAPVGFFRARMNRRAAIIEMNPTAREFFSKSTPSLREIFQNPTEYDEVINVLLSGERVQDQILQIAGPDATTRFVSFAASAVQKATGTGDFIAGTLQDVTPRHREYLERTSLVEKLQASLLFLHKPLRSLDKKLLVCDLQCSVAEVANIMTESNSTATLISSGDQILGIVTDLDLRKRMIAESLSPTTPIHTIMSAPIIKISESALVYEALLLMEEKKIQHLAVEDVNGRIVNLVENKSLIQFQSYGSVVIMREIASSSTAQEVSQLVKRTPSFAQTFIESSARPHHITRVLASICDSASERLVQLAMDDLGAQPADYAFIAMGSQGRLEQTLLTDQDNGIIYVVPAGEQDSSIQDYFLEVGARVCDGLAASGYPYCRGNVMASNPKWCRSSKDWIEGFRSGIQLPEEQEIIDLSIFLDFRTVCGNSQLTRDLRYAVNSVLAENPGIFHHFAEGALSFKPPFRFLGGIYLGGGDTDHLGEINLKDAMMPIISFARLYALKHQINQTHTLDRIRELETRGVISPASREEITIAYDLLMTLRLQNQSLLIQNGLPLTNVIRVNQLGAMQQEQLKQAFTQIAAIQKKISYDFLGGT